MSKPFNARDWYWVSPHDETVYSSRRQDYVGITDAEYAEWGADGSQPTLWPRDENGHQSDAAMEAVLASYGLTMSGSPVSAPLTFMSFLGLFSADEQTAIVSSDNPQIRLFCLMAAGANGVELSDPRTVAGTTQLETLKLIAKGRAKQVLAGQAPPVTQAAS